MEQDREGEKQIESINKREKERLWNKGDFKWK